MVVLNSILTVQPMIYFTVPTIIIFSFAIRSSSFLYTFADQGRTQDVSDEGKGGGTSLRNDVTYGSLKAEIKATTKRLGLFTIYPKNPKISDGM